MGLIIIQSNEGLKSKNWIFLKNFVSRQQKKSCLSFQCTGLPYRFWICLPPDSWVSRFLKTNIADFPAGPVVKNLPANAGDMGLIPGPWGSHMPWGNQVCVPELVSHALELMFPSKRSHRNEKTPLSATGESPRTATKAQSSQKFNKF